MKQLKEMSQQRDATFGGEFFRQVVSMNIRSFLGIRQVLRSAVSLDKRSQTHRRKKKVAAIREFTKEMEAQGLRKYRAGRYQGHTAVNDFSKGYAMMAKGSKIRDFIKRTLFDIGRAGSGAAGRGRGRRGGNHRTLHYFTQHSCREIIGTRR